MRCPSCGHDNPEDAKFCGECGGALARARPNCGAMCGQIGMPKHVEMAEALLSEV